MFHKFILLFCIVAVYPIHCLEELYLYEEEEEAENVFILSGEYLYWRANEGGLDPALQTQLTSLVATKSSVLNFKWANGFRIGVGYRMPHDQWVFAVKWTQFFDRAKSHIRGSTSVFLFPQWAPNLGPDFMGVNPLTEINGDLKIKLQMIDGEFSRKFLATCFLTLTPHIGIRGAWIDQDYLINNIGGVTLTQMPTPVLQTNVKMNCDFQGVGLRSGIDLDGEFFRLWGFYSKAGISLLYGTFSSDSNVSQFHLSDPITIENTKGQFQVSQGVAMLDIALGLKWDYFFRCSPRALHFAIGWEFNEFFDQNQFTSSIVIQPATTTASSLVFKLHDALTTQGLVVSGGIDF